MLTLRDTSSFPSSFEPLIPPLQWKKCAGDMSSMRKIVKETALELECNGFGHFFVPEPKCHRNILSKVCLTVEINYDDILRSITRM